MFHDWRYLGVALLAAGIAAASHTASATGLAGDALSFDAGLGGDPEFNLGDFVNIPDDPSLSLQELTLEAWVFVEGGPDFFERPFISKGRNRGNYTLSVLGNQTEAVPGSLSYSHRTETGNFSCCSGTPLVGFDAWTHVAATFSATTGAAAVYVNGQLVASTVTTSPPLENSDALFLGRADFGLGEFPSDILFHRGLIDEVRIWNVVRTDQEIFNNYNRLVAPNSPGLVANYHFDEGFIEGLPVQEVLDSASKVFPALPNDGTLGSDLNISSDDPTRVDSTAPIVGTTLLACEFTEAELAELCTDAQGQPIRAYTLGVGVGTNFGGPIEDFGDATCSCPGVQDPVECSTDQDAPNACSPRGFEPEVFETHALEKVGQIGSDCTLLCYPFDGIRMCVELCLN